MPIDIVKERALTPGVRSVMHFNNAGASLMPVAVLRAQIDHLNLEAEIGGYEAAEREAGRISAVYDSVASLIGADRDEIALVENATVAWQLAFYSLPLAEGDVVLTAEAEYAANYIAFLQLVRRRGIRVIPVRSDAAGEIELDALAKAITPKVKLIAITHVPTNGGLVNPAVDVGAIARAHGIPFLLDACQSVGQMPINVHELNCDFLSATGRKYLRGPRGTGFLYVRRAMAATMEPCVLDMHAAEWTQPDSYKLREDARRFENWENNYAGQLGLGAACDHAQSIGLPQIAARNAELAGRLRDGLNSIAGITNHDLGRTPCAITSFSHRSVRADAIKQRLADAGINVSVSKPSSTLLDARRRNLPELVRASVHYFNTLDEVDKLLSELNKAVTT